MLFAPALRKVSLMLLLSICNITTHKHHFQGSGFARGEGSIVVGIRKRDRQSSCVRIYMCACGLRMMECINIAWCKKRLFVISKLVPHYFSIRDNLSYVPGCSFFVYEEMVVVCCLVTAQHRWRVKVKMSLWFVGSGHFKDPQIRCSELSGLWRQELNPVLKGGEA